jgi:hypothetical protein
VVVVVVVVVALVSLYRLRYAHRLAVRQQDGMRW